MAAEEIRHKNTINVALESQSPQQICKAGSNLSLSLTKALGQEISAKETERWKKDNRAGLKELNRIVDEHGLLSDG